MTYTIRCPKCAKRKTAPTKHGFKLFALTHGVYCDASKFTVSHQMAITDFVPDNTLKEDAA